MSNKGRDAVVPLTFDDVEEYRRADEYDPDEPGVIPVFIFGEAEGAYPLNSRVRKALSNPGDATPTHTEGRVLSSFGPLADPVCGAEHFGYFIEWDNRPGLPVFVSACAGRVELV